MTTKSDTMQFLDELVGEPMTFGSMLRTIRETDELTQADIAVRLGVSVPYVSAMESGTKTPSPKTAAEYGVTLGYGMALFVKLAVQAELDRAGIGLRVSVEPSKGTSAA